MKRFISGIISFLLVPALIGVCGNFKSASASGAADFYKGKVLEFVVPYSPGGGTDTYARLIGPYLERHTGATVVIKNMPGAASIYGTNAVYTAKPNGLKIQITDTGGIVLAQLFKQKGVRYNINKFVWLGRIDGSKRVILVAKNSPYHTLKDLEGVKQIKFSSSGVTSGPGLTFSLLAHALGWPPGKLAQVSGYGGGRELMMAVMQGETDATSLSHSTAASFAKQGLVRALVTVDRERSKYLPDVPTPYEQVEVPKDRDWPLAVYLSLEGFRRGLITTPGVPQDRVDFLRHAVEKTLNDKELLAKASKVKRDIHPLSGKEMEKGIKESVGVLTEEQMNEFRYICFEKYYK